MDYPFCVHTQIGTKYFPVFRYAIEGNADIIVYFSNVLLNRLLEEVVIIWSPDYQFRTLPESPLNSTER